MKEELEDLPAGGLSSTQSLGSYYVVVRDPGIMEALLQHPTLQGSRGAYTGYKLGFDLDTSREQALALYRDLKETLSLQEEAFTMVESREAAGKTSSCSMADCSFWASSWGPSSCWAPC